MKIHRLATVVSLLCFASACSGVVSEIELPLRDGPKFAEAFGDPSVLVTTENPSAVRSILETVQLPETDEHHMRLLRILRDTTALETEHLLLLVEAVAVPEHSTGGDSLTIITNDRVLVWRRHRGPYAQIVDGLLIEGVSKLRDPSPANFGRLLSRCQTKQTLISLAKQLGTGDNAGEWDDGSTRDLEQILEQAVTDVIRLEFCVDALLPGGRLDESRAEVAVRSLGFDATRERLLRADYSRRSTLSGENLIEHVSLMSFDAGRANVVQLGAPLVAKLGGEEILKLVQLASFDEGRIQIIEALSSRVVLANSSEAIALVRTASFDSGRAGILSNLVAGSFVEVRGEDLVAFAEIASFDAGREELLKLLDPHVRSALNTEVACKLLETMSFDSGRLSAVELLTDRLADIPPADRMLLLDTFSFSSGRASARSQLGW